MKDFFNTREFKVLMAVVVFLFGLMVLTTTSTGMIFAKAIGFVTSPMQKISATATEKVTEFIDLDGLSKEELKALNQKLRLENQELTDKLLDYYEVIQENTQLKIQLKISDENEELDTVVAAVISRSPEELFSGFSIDRGSVSGVQEGDPVMTENGLVGVVSKVYPTSSTVSSILSEKVKIAGMVKKADKGGTINESGIINSEIEYAGNGNVVMRYLMNDTKVAIGDIVTTSGASGIYPPGIKIGKVLSVDHAADAISKIAVIEPFEDIRNVKDVVIIKRLPGKVNEDTGVDDGSQKDGNKDPEG